MTATLGGIAFPRVGRLASPCRIKARGSGESWGRRGLARPDFPPPNNAFHMHIERLSPVFIDSLYAEITSPHFNCTNLDTSVPGVCVHRAGLDGGISVAPPGQRRFQSVGAIVLSCEIMPVGACPSLQDPSGSGLTFLYDLELTR